MREMEREEETRASSWSVAQCLLVCCVERRRRRAEGSFRKKKSCSAATKKQIKPQQGEPGQFYEKTKTRFSS